MHFQVLALSGLAALTSALPSHTTNVIEARGISDACAAQPSGYGPSTNPATATGFLQWPAFSTISTAATTPSGYQRTFHNHVQSTSGSKYMGLYTLTSYDTSSCASLCSGSVGCLGFNVFYERDPLQNPAPTCMNPSPTTQIKCTLWGQPPTVVNATNAGQMRSGFTVVIAGSNGYAIKGSVPASLADDGTNQNN